MLRRVSKRREVSSIVAVTPDGRLFARHFRGSVSSEEVILALRHFRRGVGAPLLVVWDRLNASPLAPAFSTASTLLGVNQLGYPGQLVELDVTAVL